MCLQHNNLTTGAVLYVSEGENKEENSESE